MSNESYQYYFINREEAKHVVSDSVPDADKRDTLFILTAVMVAQDKLKDREGTSKFFDYAINHQEKLLSLAREFDGAIKAFNGTTDAATIDPSYVNTISVREKRKLGDERIPLFLGEHRVRPKEAIGQMQAGVDALTAQNKYMKNSEDARTNEELLKAIHSDSGELAGQWSELHLHPESPKHFLATFIVDLYPGLLSRWLQSTKEGKVKQEDLDTDELVRALCENMDPKSELFKLINEQGWFDDNTFSPEFRAGIQKQKNDLPTVQLRSKIIL
jgi:hypothetical protein